MKTKTEIEQLTYENMITYFASVGVNIRAVTKEEIHEFYQNRLAPNKYGKFASIIDDSTWNHEITNQHTVVFCNESQLVQKAMQAITPATVTHK